MDNKMVANELRKIATEIVAYDNNFPIEYHMMDQLKRDRISEKMKEYVQAVNTMFNMFSDSGSVCKGKLLETLHSFENCVTSNL